MELKEKLLSSFIAFESTVDVEAPIHPIRFEALKRFERQGFPTKKEEAWKYTSLTALLTNDYTLFPKTEKAPEFKDVKNYFLHEIDSYKIVFIDGQYASHLSETSHEGLDICLMSAALTKPKYQLIIDTYFNKATPPEDSLTALNTAFAREGAYINIPRNKIVQKPIQIIHLATGNEAALMLQPRNLLVVGENSHVQIIERHQSLTSQPVLTNTVTEIFAHNKAVVEYYKIQDDTPSASLIDHTGITQKKNSHVSVHTFSLGGNLTRNNLNFYHKDERATSTLKGITLIGNQQHVDHHTLVQHAFPHGESHQDYKGVFMGNSTGIFNGRIVVASQAQKTNAFQQNNNILLEDRASVNAKPQLEIFADDVKCSHGCTIGQLDQETLFYLRTRGIPEKEAKALLMYGFAGNVLKSVKIPELKQRIHKLIARKLSVNIGFDL